MLTEHARLTKRASFRLWWAEVVRYGDMDVQGHVNNVSFAQYSESARVDFLYNKFKQVLPEDCYFVIAKLVVDFRQEVMWPAVLDIGSGILAVGRTSFTLGQGMFVGQECVSTAENVLVLNKKETRRSTPLPESFRAHLERFAVPPGHG